MCHRSRRWRGDEDLSSRAAEAGSREATERRRTAKELKMRELRWNPGEKYAGSNWNRARVTRAPAGTAHLEFLRRPSASPPLRGYVPPATLDDSPFPSGDFFTASQDDSMNRVAKLFRRLKSEHRCGLIAYVTCGDG